MPRPNAAATAIEAQEGNAVTPAAADARPPRRVLQVVDMNTLGNRLSKVASQIAARLKDEDVQKAVETRSLEEFLRRTLQATVSDVFGDERLKMSRPLYGGVRSGVNPVFFLVKHYKMVIERSMFFQADLGRCDEKLLMALRNAQKSKHWSTFCRAADVDLQASGSDWACMFGRRVKDAKGLEDLIPPRKNLDQQYARLQDDDCATDAARASDDEESGSAKAQQVQAANP